MDFSQFMLALRARRKAFMLVLAAVIVTAVAVALLVPKKYVGTATLLLDARDEQTRAPTRLSARERAGYLATQLDLIKSGRVAARVSRDLKLAQQPGMREEWQRDTEGVIAIDDWIALGLLDRVSADISGSNVITLKYASSDPRKAATIANAFAKAYIDTVLEMRTEPTREAADWFNEQLNTLRAQVNQAQAKIAGFQKAKGIVSVEERADVESSRLAELSTQYLAAKNATYEAKARHRQAQEVLASGTPDAMTEIMSSAAIAAVRADLARAEGALQSASADLGPNHPVYKRAEAEVAALRGKLTAEMKKVVASIGHAAQQAQRREDELKNALAAQSDHIQAMRGHRVELAVMTRDVESAQRAYDAVLARFMTNKIESTANKTNAALLTPALEPLTPSQPKVGLISGLAVVLGLLLASAVVYIA
jgi:polysaccharide biosynthesis transport protein